MRIAKNEMTRKVSYVLETDDLEDAYRSMSTLGIHHVPVMRLGKVVGMLSDRDILLHTTEKNGKRTIAKRKVGEVAGPVVYTCSPINTIAAVADTMLNYGVHALPVVAEDGVLAGIITSTDLLAILRDGEFTRESSIPFVFEAPVSLFGSVA